MPCALQLASAVVRLAQAALRAVDLRTHVAAHPRLGVVDHVLCSPLGSSDTCQAVQAAAAIARALACGDPPVPIYLCARRQTLHLPCACLPVRPPSNPTPTLFLSACAPAVKPYAYPDHDLQASKFPGVASKGVC